MKKRIVLLLLAVTLTVVCTACGSRSYDIKTSSVHRPVPAGYVITDNEVPLAASPDIDTKEFAMANSAFEQVNQERRNAGLPALVWSNGLYEAAKVRAGECSQLFSHTRPNGTDWWTVNDKIMFGENLATGYNEPNEAVNAWMASPAHKANILDGGFVTCAIAIYAAPDGTLYWAQEFGY